MHTYILLSSLPVRTQIHACSEWRMIWDDVLAVLWERLTSDTAIGARPTVCNHFTQLWPSRIVSNSPNSSFICSIHSLNHSTDKCTIPSFNLFTERDTWYLQHYAWIRNVNFTLIHTYVCTYVPYTQKLCYVRIKESSTHHAPPPLLTAGRRVLCHIWYGLHVHQMGGGGGV